MDDEAKKEVRKTNIPDGKGNIKLKSGRWRRKDQLNNPQNDNNRPSSKMKSEISENKKKKKELDVDFKVKMSSDSKNKQIRRNPVRQVGKKNYEEIDEPQEDRYIFCDFCQESFLDSCPKCGQLAFLQDVPVEMGVENRAKLTLPETSLVIMGSQIHGLGVFAKVALKKGIKMGPYEGKTTRVESTSGYSWKLKNGQLVDAGDERFSNWMRYVNCARHCKEQNLMAFQYKGHLYYRTCQNIKPGQELLVFYGNSFANNLGIDIKGYFKPKEENIIEFGEYCQYCCVGYKDASRLENHTAVCKVNPDNIQKVPDKIFKCRYCPVGITNEEYFRSHETRCEKKSRNNKENIKVNKDRRNIRGEELKKDRERVNGKKYACTKCEYVTNRSWDMKRHQRTHDNVSLFVCDFCNKGFNQRNHLQEHMFKHLEIAEEFHVLESMKICENNATKKIISAKFNGRNVKILTYKCDRCIYETVNTSDIRRHVHGMHENKKQFKCRFCVFCSVTKTHTSKHENRVHLKSEVWKCKHCNYKSFLKCTITSHIKAMHLKIKDHLCGICGYKASTRSKLRSHLDAVHLKIKNHSCGICGYKTSRIFDLKKHLHAVHLKIKNHSCEICGYKTSTRSDLKRHLHAVHLKDKE